MESKKITLFGFCNRDEMNKDSDIDILIDIEADISLLDFVGLKQKIEEALGRNRKICVYPRTIRQNLRSENLYNRTII